MKGVISQPFHGPAPGPRLPERVPLLTFFGSTGLVKPGGEAFHHYDVTGFGSLAQDLLRLGASTGAVNMGS